MTITSLNERDRLRENWSALVERDPKLRIRNAARALGVSEAELVATRLGDGVVRLDGPWPTILGRIEALGTVMALTRNDHAVHERTGTYRDVSVNGASGLVLDEEIDLRVFFGQWHHGFAVEEPSRVGLRRSLQFFDAHGTAVHKIYLTDESDLAAWARLVDDHRAHEQDAPLDVQPPAAAADTEPEPVDYDGLYDEWRRLEDTHDFHPLLRRFRVGRVDALRNAEADLALPVAVGAAREMLQTASERAVAIMVFVGSPGVIQIHTGPVERIVETGPWINVLDERFNLHLREDAVASAWIVRKPTRDGVVTSLEIFDADERQIALFFGRRKPGVPESDEWRAVVEAVEQRCPMA